MRANLCRDIVQSLFFHNFHHLRNTFCGTMAQMQSRTCLSGKKNISRCDYILNCIADTRQSQPPCIFIIVHTSISAQINILAMCKNRNIEFLCHFHGLFAEPGIHNRFTILRQCRDSGFYHSFDIGKFLPFLSLRNGTSLKYMNAGKLFCFIMHIVYTIRTVNYRCCIRHCNNRCHTTSGSSPGTCLYILLLCLSRIPEMNVKINQSRHYQTPLRIYYSVTVIFYFKFLTDLSDHSVFQINIAFLISVSSRIYDASSLNQNTHAILSLRCHLTITF